MKMNKAFKIKFCLEQLKIAKDKAQKDADENVGGWVEGFSAGYLQGFKSALYHTDYITEEELMNTTIDYHIN